MKTIKVTMYMDVDDEFVEDAIMWEHHIDQLMDLDNYPEIASVYGVQVEEEGEA